MRVCCAVLLELGWWVEGMVGFFALLLFGKGRGKCETLMVVWLETAAARLLVGCFGGARDVRWQVNWQNVQSITTPRTRQPFAFTRAMRVSDNSADALSRILNPRPIHRALVLLSYVRCLSADAHRLALRFQRDTCVSASGPR